MKLDHTQEDAWGRHYQELLSHPAVQAELMYMPNWRYEDRVRFQAVAACLVHRDAIIAQRNRLRMEHNLNDDDMVIVCPNAEVGPGAEALDTFYSLKLRPEHSATEWRVVWEHWGPEVATPHIEAPHLFSDIPDWLIR